VLFASDLIEHDGGDLRDLPLIDRKRRLAELIEGQASRHARRTNCISRKLESAQYAWRSQRERTRKPRS
jgi:ATP-dependent DNA ligase